MDLTHPLVSEDVWFLVFAFLDVFSICNCFSVCRDWIPMIEHIIRTRPLQIHLSDESRLQGFESRLTQWPLCLWFENLHHGGRMLVAMLNRTNCVQSLSLSHCQASDDLISELSVALMASKIKALYLNSNLISDVGLRSISNFLSSNSSLQILDLENNTFSPEGLRHLSRSLVENTKLKSLMLAGNNLGDEGILVLGKMLKKNKSIIELGLERNNISPIGLSKFTKSCFSRNTNLCTLALNDNELGDEGVKDLMDALTKNQTMKILCLSECSISDLGGEYIARGIKMNSSLVNLRLARNPIKSWVTVSTSSFHHPLPFLFYLSVKSWFHLDQHVCFADPPCSDP